MASQKVAEMTKSSKVNDEPVDDAVTGRTLRKALGRFVSGVTVVTTPQGDAVHAMTANAFTSVSLDPPLVLVSIAKTAKMDERIAASGKYGVSILARSQEPHSLHFAGAKPYDEEISWSWREGVPLLDGSLVQLSCSVTDSHPAGDHTLHVGHVDGLWTTHGDPLVFFTGSFRALDITYPDDPWGF